MKKWLFHTALCLLSCTALAQQLPQYSGYFVHKLVLNPAVTGSQPYMDFKLHHRTQWAGFDDAPSTQILSMHSSIDNKNFGVGGYLFNDNHGIIQTMGANLSYAYHIPLDENTKLGMGLSGAYTQIGIDGGKINLHDPDDQLVDLSINSRETTFTGSFGTLLHNDNYYFGLSILDLFHTDFQFFDQATAPLEPHYYLMGGKWFDFTNKSSIQPSFLINAVPNNPTQADLRLNYDYGGIFQFGAGYRTGDAIVLSTAVYPHANLGIYYSYDLTTSNLKNHNSGSHEIVLHFIKYYNPIYKKNRKRYKLNIVSEGKDSGESKEE